MSAPAAEWRDEISSIVQQYRQTPGDAPPPQLVEAMVNLESGFDARLIQPESGAIGLGQVMTNGMEWQAFVNDPVMQARYPGAKDDPTGFLLNGANNLEVMIYGLNMRQEMGGALQDWYMTAASYLGGATVDGFNGEADALGTNGQAYVMRVQEYIADTWGMDTLETIDRANPGAVMYGLSGDPGRVYFDPNRLSALDGSIPAVGYDPNDLYTEEHYLKADDGGVLGGVWGKIKDVYDIAKDPAGAIGALISAIVDGIGAVLPRIGLFIAGAAILGVGLYAARGTVL